MDHREIGVRMPVMNEVKFLFAMQTFEAAIPPGIVGVMKVDVVVEEPTAHRMVAELVMHQCLSKRHDQMRSDGSHEIERKRRQ